MATQFEIPSSNATVKVSIIDSTAHIYGFPMKLMVVPEMQGNEFLDCPSYSFLIEHTDSSPERVVKRVLFDLGVRNNWTESLPPHIVKWLLNVGMGCDVQEEVGDILDKYNAKDDTLPASKDINTIIFSHEHWDHTGNVAHFPPSTNLLLGPGFKAKHCPGYPDNQASSVLQSNYTGRSVEELDFTSENSNTLTIGGIQVIDFFEDGSFYLLDMPGHAVGHVGALARTTGSDGQSSFILMAADACHHAGEFRPSTLLPLPDQVAPDPRLSALSSKLKTSSVCPGSLYTKVHRTKSTKEPFYIVPAPGESDEVAGPYDFDAHEETLRSLVAFDARDDVLVIMAHDTSFLALGEGGEDVFFPKDANRWKERGWKELVQWKFLGDFAVDEKR